MEPDHEAFLRAICAAPDDDAPRLVYADWLEERGETNLAEVLRTSWARSMVSAVYHVYRDRDGVEQRNDGSNYVRAWMTPGTGLWRTVDVSHRRKRS